VAQQTPSAKPEAIPVPALDKAISDRQVWDKMLVQFENSPFVYDVLMNSSVEFSTPNTWTLKFAPGKEFYQIPAQNKLAELSAAASQISGRTISIQLATDAVLNEGAKQESSSHTAKENKISDEEPFAKGPFAPEETTSPADAPEEVKKILDIFPGELMA
jgi:hypothetical protein